MRFRYPLQKIVDLKANEKSQAEWMLTEAIQHLTVEETTLQSLHDEKSAWQHQLLQHVEERASVHELKQAQQYIQHVEHQIQSKHLDVQRAKSNVERKQDHLVNRMLDEKVWMKAKESAYHKYVAVQLKKDQEQLDEIVTNRHGRAVM